MTKVTNASYIIGGSTKAMGIYWATIPKKEVFANSFGTVTSFSE